MNTKKPNNWQTKRLDEVATITMGQSPPSSSYNDQGFGTPFFQGKPSNIDNFGVAVPHQHTTEPTKVVSVGTALMTVRAPVGDIFTSSTQVCIGRGLSGIMANPDILQEYLNYQLQFSSQQFQALSQGSTFTAINSSDLKSIKVGIPVKNIQQKIAEILSAVDEAIQKTDQIIKKTEKLKRGLMNDLLTHGIGRKKYKLSEVINDFIVPMRNKPKNFSGDIPWCRIEDFNGIYLSNSKSGQYVNDQTIKEMKLRVYPINTVLVSCSADLGRCAITSKPLVTNQTFIGLVPSKKINSLFLFYLMSSISKKLNNLASGTTILYLSRKRFENLSINVPPLIKQIQISKILKSIDDKLTKSLQQKEKYLKLKTGLMHDIFNQKVEVN